MKMLCVICYLSLGATSCVSFTSSTSVQSVAAVDAVKYTHSPQNHGVSSTTACSQAFSRYVNKDVMVETNCPAESNVIPASAYISIAGYENQQLNYPIDSIHSVEGKTVSCKGPYMHTQETTYTWSVEDCVSSTTHGSVVTKDPQKMGSPVQGALVSTSNELQLSPKDSETGDLNGKCARKKVNLCTSGFFSQQLWEDKKILPKSSTFLPPSQRWQVDGQWAATPSPRCLRGVRTHSLFQSTVLRVFLCLCCRFLWRIERMSLL